jgi:hypothetical protein
MLLARKLTVFLCILCFSPSLTADELVREFIQKAVKTVQLGYFVPEVEYVELYLHFPMYFHDMIHN